MSDHHLIRRYSMSLGSSKLSFIRRPVSIPPTANTICWVDRGNVDRADRYVAAKFEDGQWLDQRGRPLNVPPLFWTEMDTDA